jgi:hypothetical protein
MVKLWLLIPLVISLAGVVLMVGEILILDGERPDRTLWRYFVYSVIACLGIGIGCTVAILIRRN